MRCEDVSIFPLTSGRAVFTFGTGDGAHAAKSLLRKFRFCVISAVSGPLERGHLLIIRPPLPPPMLTPSLQRHVVKRVPSKKALTLQTSEDVKPPHSILAWLSPHKTARYKVDMTNVAQTAQYLHISTLIKPFQSDSTSSGTDADFKPRSHTVFRVT